jgi:hypothetical protein
LSKNWKKFLIAYPLFKKTKGQKIGKNLDSILNPLLEEGIKAIYKAFNGGRGGSVLP